MEEQYTADTVVQVVAAWDQALRSRTPLMRCVLWRLSKTPRRLISSPQNHLLDPPVGVAPEGVKPYARSAQSEPAPTANPRVFSHEG